MVQAIKPFGVGLGTTFPGNSGTKEGREMALRDLLAKLETRPVYSLLGRRIRDELNTVFFIGAVDLEPGLTQ